MTSWDRCDLAEKIKFGQCRAITGDKEPNPCGNWAINVYGWCGVHYGSELERVKREERANLSREERNERIETYLAWRETHPSVWDRMALAESVHPALTDVNGSGRRRDPGSAGNACHPKRQQTRAKCGTPGAP